MKLRLHHSLFVRLGLIVLACLTVMTFIAAQTYYSYIYDYERKEALNNIDQLQATVANTMSIAVYLNDVDLANEVVSGLLKNEVIQAVEIRSDYEILASTSAFDSVHAREYTLYNPFFENELMGKVLIVPNLDFIEQSAQEIASLSARTAVVNMTISVIIFIFFAYFVVTKPMAKLTKQLLLIEPASNQRLPKIPYHKHSELGLITRNINALLERTEHLVKQERTLRKSVETLSSRLNMLFENSRTAMALARMDGEIVIKNDSFSELITGFGFELKSNYNAMLGDIFERPNEILKLVNQALSDKNTVQAEFAVKDTTNEGRENWINVQVTLTQNDDGEQFYLFFLTDISARKAQFNKLEKQATSDQLTGLLNRLGGENEMREQMDLNVPFALMLIDLDGFKPINDTYGHDVGDDMLVHVATQISHTIRRNDIAIRWGGDEFVVAITDATPDDALNLAYKLIRAISKPIETSQGVEVNVGASIGLAMFPYHSWELEDLLDCADKAMYEVKKSGKNDAKIFNA